MVTGEQYTAINETNVPQHRYCTLQLQFMPYSTQVTNIFTVLFIAFPIVSQEYKATAHPDWASTLTLHQTGIYRVSDLAYYGYRCIFQARIRLSDAMYYDCDR